jgi:hypothetical protein
LYMGLRTLKLSKCLGISFFFGFDHHIRNQELAAIFLRGQMQKFNFSYDTHF